MKIDRPISATVDILVQNDRTICHLPKVTPKDFRNFGPSQRSPRTIPKVTKNHPKGHQGPSQRSPSLCSFEACCAMSRMTTKDHHTAFCHASKPAGCYISLPVPLKIYPGGSLMFSPHHAILLKIYFTINHINHTIFHLLISSYESNIICNVIIFVFHLSSFPKHSRFRTHKRYESSPQVGTPYLEGIKVAVWAQRGVGRSSMGSRREKSSVPEGRRFGGSPGMGPIPSMGLVYLPTFG